MAIQDYFIKVEVLDGGKLPVKAHYTDAGFDLFATSDIVLHPGTVQKHPLNIRIQFPKGCWGRVETKSGLGAQGMLVYAGVVDEGYRGIPHVIMTNLNNHPDHYKVIRIEKGQKLAQLTIHPHDPLHIVVQVDKVDTATERGEGGFGSSGK